MNRQRPIRPPQTKAIGILANNEVTTSLLAKKKKTDPNRSPSNAPITNPLREKTWGREEDESQVRYGQKLARAAHVTPMLSAVRTSNALRTSLRRTNKTVRKKRSPSASPIALPFQETIRGLA